MCGEIEPSSLSTNVEGLSHCLKSERRRRRHLTLVITILWVVATEFRGGGRRSDYAGATAPPVRLGARRHQSAHGAQKNHVQPIRLATMIMPNGE